MKGLVELPCERINYRIKSAHIGAELIIFVGSMNLGTTEKKKKTQNIVDRHINRHTGPQTNQVKWDALMGTPSQGRNKDYHSDENRIGNSPVNIYKMPQQN